VIARQDDIKGTIILAHLNDADNSVVVLHACFHDSINIFHTIAIELIFSFSCSATNHVMRLNKTRIIPKYRYQKHGGAISYVKNQFNEIHLTAFRSAKQRSNGTMSIANAATPVSRKLFNLRTNNTVISVARIKPKKRFMYNSVR